jgi:hypothetical protein
MKNYIAILPLLLCTNVFAAETPAQPAMTGSKNEIHRYLVERTFPPGALEGLDAATKAKVNANNASVGVHWVQSYANADMTKTYCIYEGPNEGAIKSAAALNKLPIDSIVEVPVDLDSASKVIPGQHVAKKIVK